MHCIHYYDSGSFLNRLNRRLSELESEYRVMARWSMTDPQYIDAKSTYLKEIQQRLRESTWATITRRQYLLKMKAKYAGK